MKNLKTLLCSLLFVLTVLVVTEPVKAEGTLYPYVRNIKQVSQTDNSVTVTWEADDCTNYRIDVYDYYDYGSPVKAQYETTQTTYTIPNLSPGSKYEINVYGWHYSDITDYSYDYEVIVTPVTELAEVKQTKWWHWAENLDVEATEYDAATYEAQLYNSKGKLLKSDESNINYFSFKIEPAKVYVVKMRAKVIINDVPHYSNWKSVTCLEQTFPKSHSVNKKKKTITIKWNKVEGATGYELWMSQKPNSGYKKVKSFGKKTTSYTVKKFNKKKINPKKKYYYFIRTKKGKSVTGALYYWCTKSSVSDVYYLKKSL